MDDTYTIDVTPRRGLSRFDRKEVVDIAAAVIVLSAAFMVLYRNQGIMDYLDHHLGALRWPALFGVCLVIVLLSFLLHELGHKFVAQNHGMRSGFRMWPAGLLITLVTSLFGFLFAAPGAVVINGYPDKRTNGHISIAGPIVNIVLCAVGIGGCIALNYTPWVLFFTMLASLNAFLAFFNLLPIPPLDGSKVAGWNIGVYVAVLAVAVVELAYIYLWMPDLYYTYRRRLPWKRQLVWYSGSLDTYIPSFLYSPSSTCEIITDECTSLPLRAGKAANALSAWGSVFAAMDSATSISSMWRRGFLLPR